MVELCGSITFWVEITLPHGNKIISKKKICSGGTKLAIIHYFILVKIFTFQEKLLFPLKGFLASPTYRRCVKVVFRKSALAFLGPTSTANMTLSKAISAAQSFLPQVSGWSACNCLVSYLTASFTPMKTSESHLCWLKSYSARHKRTKGNCIAGRAC